MKTTASPLQRIRVSLRGAALLLASSTLIGWAPVAAAATPEVAVSIAPLHSLASAVMAGVGQPTLLLLPGGSEHSAALRPTGARALQDAALIVWVGPQLERSLVRPLANLRGGKVRIVEVMSLPSVKKLPMRHDHAGHGAHSHRGNAVVRSARDAQGVRVDDDDRHDGHAAGAGDGSDGPGARRSGQMGNDRSDPHVWLDPRNGRAIVTALADALAEIDPANAGRYRRNAMVTNESLALLERELNDELEPVRARRVAVFHDAWQYFEQAFGLPPFVAITVDPDRPPTVGQRREVEQAVRESDVRCIFAEPQHDGKIIAGLADQFGLASGMLDPIGAKVPLGPSQYEATLRGIAGNLLRCR